jgi:hypothetical protein
MRKEIPTAYDDVSWAVFFVLLAVAVHMGI